MLPYFIIFNNIYYNSCEKVVKSVFKNFILYFCFINNFTLDQRVTLIFGHLFLSNIIYGYSQIAVLPVNPAYNYLQNKSIIFNF